VSGLALLAGVATAAGRVEPPLAPGEPYHYRPQLTTPDWLAPFLEEMTPGSDMFPDERVAGELISLLGELSERLRKGPDHAADVLLAPTFRGGRLRPVEEQVVASGSSLRVVRSREMSEKAGLGSGPFGEELSELFRDFREITVAELLITALEVDREKGRATSRVRYDFVGPGREAFRVERVGAWRLSWQRGPDGWRVTEWTAIEDTESSAPAPIFTDVSAAALGSNDSYRRQLRIDFDSWVATMDAAITRDANGHNGVSVGDADGDGLDDFYVAQPYAFPNRLFRARGDGTFEDVTDRAGLAILEDTQHSLFADVDNDGDQDLVITLSSGPNLFLNDGTGRFSRVPGAFQYKKALQGGPMSVSAADFDRDGRLDLYLSVYSFYYGASEGKAGTPTPYYDAVNGPPSVLFWNDGQGHFVEVTDEVGMEVGNDRFTFSAAWGDYDHDGWPDLVATNDFGRKNLYHNLGPHDGKVRFEGVEGKAGVEDYAAGMGILWFDFDGDGQLDIYAGQMWSDSGLRVTASREFMPGATPEVLRLYHHHANGNSLLRNRGDGTFEDLTQSAGANMGRWTWSAGALDFDSDGWEDLYMVNGMVTRRHAQQDIDWFFWGGVVARSPLIQATGTPYDDAWRAMNRALWERSIASHHRNVFLRNDGQGHVDDVSGTLGLDLDQDGRSFGVLDFDQDGDPDLVVMAPRSAPQLRLFRNDYGARGATLAVRLVGDPVHPFVEEGKSEGRVSNRDAIGARVTVETDQLRRTRVVEAGSGFISQHSKELLFGLGASQRLERLTVEWPSGRTQVFTDLPLERRLRIEEGGEPQVSPYQAMPALAPDVELEPAAPLRATWLFAPFPSPDIRLPDLQGRPRALADLRGRPAVLLCWAAEAPPSVAALRTLADGSDRLGRAGIGALAIAFDPPEAAAGVREAASGVTSVPVAVATEEVALSLAILNRHIYMNRQPLVLPSTFLLDAEGRIQRIYREGVDVAEIVRDAGAMEPAPTERLGRSIPFSGDFYAPLGSRDYLPWGRELLDEGLEAQAVVAFEQVAEGKPSSSILYRLGTLLVKTGQNAKARSAYERALELQPDLSEASNDLGTLLAESGDLPGAIERFRAALETSPDYPDALNNLGYALLLSGRGPEARKLYERALELQPDFPQALNNLGLILAQQGSLDQAEPYFRKALEGRPDYGEAANNLALVLVNSGRTDEAVRLLRGFIDAHPEVESPYLTLAKVLLSTGRQEEGLSVIDRLLERDPDNAQALGIARAFRQ